MADGSKAPLRLSIRSLSIAALPLAVIALSGAMVHRFGSFGGEFTPVAAARHGEAAGRLMAIAAWLVLLAAVLACLAYFFASLFRQPLRRLDQRSQRILVGAYVVLAMGGLVLVRLGFAGEANRAVADAFIRGALSLPIYQPPTGPIDLLPFHGSGFDLFQGLNSIQRYLLALLTPALVLGSLACLAAPARGRDAALRRCQAERLTTYLYLSAMVLVAGLIFLSAILRWPAYGLTGIEATNYSAHVGAYVFYWGVTYSILIASYYVPAAALLAGFGGAVETDEAAGVEARAQLFATLKSAAALFAPALAGLIGGVIHL